MKSGCKVIQLPTAQSQKNLLILLTPTLMDPAGNRLFDDDDSLPQTEPSANIFPGALPQTKSP